MQTKYNSRKLTERQFKAIVAAVVVVGAIVIVVVTRSNDNRLFFACQFPLHFPHCISFPCENSLTKPSWKFHSACNVTSTNYEIEIHL